MILEPGFSPDSLRGLEGFSHLWLTFQFHLVAENETREVVRPPRLGGNQKVGVFASRSPYRPNRLGLSLVGLLEIISGNDRPALLVGGLDLVDGTPVFDIKPYLPDYESLPEARAGFAPEPPPRLPVEPAPEIATEYTSLPLSVRNLIEQTLSLDPRPAYHHDPARPYHVLLGDFEITWRAGDCGIEILSWRNSS